MGNSHAQPPSNAPPIDDILNAKHSSLTLNGKLTKDLLIKEFGSHIADALLTYFGSECSLAEFTKKSRGLVGSSGDQCINMLFRGHLQYDIHEDDRFISALATDLIGTGDHDVKVSVSDSILWKNGCCPNLTRKLQSYLHAKLFDEIWEENEYPGSHLLTPMQMWFIHSALPQTYIPPKDYSWKILLQSSEHGLSYRSFEKHVLGYPGSTISILELTDGQIYCLGVDEEWRDSSQQWGKSNSILIQLLDKFGVRENGASILFFNSKTRGLPNCLTIGNAKKPSLSIPSDFCKLHSLEVWGCAGEVAFQAQKNQKHWEGKQIEKQKKVPLPGKWDENPDRSLLEMAGISKVPTHFSRD